MSSGIRVDMSSRGVKDLLTSSDVRSDLRERAQRVLSAAQSDASNYVVTGNYLAGLEVQDDTTDRAVVRIVGTAPYSHLVEAEHGTLARALDAGR
ncbi:MAG: hypothetical protein JWO15_3845 [Sphingomonadales bacterium]|nr:hypothetical protein [Sphingomonadales bacterium]